ncbi:unnamed protein product [Candida verbasci]|uniref:PH domain-containing protein n=1 Tax=Candida verbasci TaxID=1227364 RepID=A0A9W4TW27_9ASCO|nr:unnamed protein product [Candida verbasci]
MDNLETLEIHSKDFLIKWINAPDNSIIDWQVKPLKKSINFAFYRKKDDLSQTTEANGSSSTALDPITPPPPLNNRARSGSTASVNQFTKPNDVYKSKSRSSTLSSINEKSDLTLIKNYNKLVANELVRGKFEVSKGGMFAFVFDNSFSKTIAKSVQFKSEIVTPEQQHTYHDQHVFDLEQKSSTSGDTLQSVMLKKRRKKLQGFTKRYFVLNIQRGLLSYFKVDDRKLRGQMPIKESIVSANPSNRELIIDSGMEVWHLKAVNQADFNAWVNAFNAIKKEEVQQLPQKQEKPLSSSTISNGPTATELQVLAFKIDQLKTENPQSELVEDIHADFMTLLAKAKGEQLSSTQDTQSVFSSDFQDAQDHFYEDSGVVYLDEGKTPQQYEEINEVEESSDEEEDEEDDYQQKQGTLEAVPVATSTPEQQQQEPQAQDLPQPTVSEDDNLYPLPHDPVSRDADVPICNHTPPSVLSFVRKNVGKDLSTIAMPVTYNEPTTVLQKFAEMLEYPDIVTNALEAEVKDDSGEKILRIAAFALSSLSSQRAKERNKRKPFNPLLGETYELVREDLGFRLISEKVSHRPPVFAYHIDTESWTLAYTLAPSQKFWGKQFEVTTKGNIYLTDKLTGEVFTWTQPTTLIKNIIAGETYAEPSGTVTIKSSTGYRALVEFAKGGMWSGRSEGVSVKALDKSKKELSYTINGNWTESFTLKTKSTEKTIWQAGELLPNYQKKYGFTTFTGTLNKITAMEQGQLAPTDSRLRPDLQCYEQGDVEKAEELKNKLEQDQRVRRKELEDAGKEHEPKFFKFKGNGPVDEGDWEFIQGEKSYWNRRKDQDWDDLIKLW